MSVHLNWTKQKFRKNSPAKFDAGSMNIFFSLLTESSERQSSSTEVGSGIGNRIWELTVDKNKKKKLLSYIRCIYMSSVLVWNSLSFTVKGLKSESFRS